MINNFVKLGTYIELYDQLNNNKEFSTIDKLQGINNNKYFQESNSNKNDIDLYRYRICRKGMFAYNKATSRNGEKISIAYRDGNDCLVSPSYVCFYIKDENVLMHEYLMLLFKRPVFDRYVRFNSWGSATEFFPWEDMKEVKIPLLSIAEQKKIVNTFNIIENKIKAIKKIDSILFKIGKLLVLKAHDNSEIFSQEDLISVNDYCDKICSGGTPSRTNDEFWNSNDYFWMKNGEVKNNIILSTEEYISDLGLKNSSAKLLPEFSVNMAMYCVSDVQVSLNVVPICTNQAVLNMSTDSLRKSAILYYYLASFGNDLTVNANGSAQQNLSKDEISSFLIKKPYFENHFFDLLENNINERIKLNKQIFTLEKLEKLLIDKIL